MLAFGGRYLKQAPEKPWDSAKSAVTDLEKGSIAARDKPYCGKMAGLRDALWTVFGSEEWMNEQERLPS